MATRALGVTLAAVLGGAGLSAIVLAQEVQLSGFSIPPGTSVTIEFDVTIDNPLDVCATSVSNQAQIAATGVTQFGSDDPDIVGVDNPTITPLTAVDLAITKTDGSATEVPGTSVTYTIVVTNAGPVDAVGATVVDTFPASITGVTWTCLGAGGGICAAAGAGNINEMVTVPVGGSVTFTASGTIAAGATGSLVNTATVTAPMGQIECNLANNSATDTNTLTPEVDLAITKTDGLGDVDAGSPTSYTITVSNSGPSDAIGATVGDIFPPELLAPTWTCVASAGSSCTAGPAAGTINDVVTVLVGGTLTYTVNATVSGTASGTLSNTATVAAAIGTTDTNPGNNSATDTTTINPVADLAITKTDGVTSAVPGMTVTYTIVASNAGPATAIGANVSDSFPAVLTCTWTCVGAGGGSCAAGPVVGDIADSVDLPAGASATYTAVCTIDDTATGTLSNTATISGGGVSDTNPGNNSATDNDTVLRDLDFGDAPDSSLAGPSGYPTLLADDGARHGITSLRMGAQIDAETDGQPTVDADGDDTTDLADEDGVTLPAFLVTCEQGSVTVNASAVARLDAWIDFNADGDWDDPGEKIFDNEAVAAGDNVLAFTVPCSATPSAKTFARFRLSSAGGLDPTGVAADGEVEDYTVGIRGLDFGDAPDPTYPTLFALDGARHVVTGSGPILGAVIDAEADGQPNPTATGDDLAGLADEDGVSFTSPLFPGLNATVTVIASTPGLLDAWLDFNADGTFATTGDQIFTSQALVAGPNNLVFAVPASASSNTATFSRWRISSAGGLTPTGLASDGEVEDHAVSIAPVADLQITKTDGATTSIPGTNVVYTIVASNVGPDPITGATVVDTFAPPLVACSWTSVAAGGATGNTPGPQAGNINEVLTLPAGASVTYTATCSIDPSATGVLNNVAMIAGPAGAFDPDLGNNGASDLNTLTPEADLAITKTDGAASSIPGTPISYTIVATNIGPSTATGVSVTDTFPAALSGCSWTSLAAGGATGNTAGPVAGNIAETGITMPPGSSITYSTTCNIDPAARGTLVNTVTVASATTDPVPGNNSATDTNTLTPQVDLVVAKQESVDPVTAGSGSGNLTYTISLTNAGPSTATAVTLSEVLTLPAGVSLVSVTPSQGGFIDPTWTVGTIAPSAVATLTVVLTVGPSAASGTDVICDTASVTGAAEPLINNGDDTATECTSIARLVDIVVTKVESADPIAAGSGAGNLTYTVTVTNAGPSDASGITLSEVLTTPAGVTVDSITPSQGGFVDPTWTVGALAANASATLTVVLTVGPSAVEGTDVICNTASLTAVAEPQSNTGNDSATECTSIVLAADLEITKIDLEDPPSDGQTVVYELTVENHGPSNATGVVITDNLPAELTLVSTSGCNEDPAGAPTCTIGALAAGASVTVTITATTGGMPVPTVTNTASVVGDQFDPDTGNNSDSEDTSFDIEPPEIDAVTTIAPPADGELDDCDTVLGAVSAIRVTFSEVMATSGAGSVVDTDNWRLVQPGVGSPFATTDCSGFIGTDQLVALDSVSWNPGTFDATLSFTSSPLADGQYRLLVCESTTDLAGNPIVGDGVTEGTPLVRTFRVDRDNLLADAHFDTVTGCSLAAWTSTNPAAVAIDSPDAGGAVTSGSASNTAATVGFDLAQCVPVVGGQLHRLEAAIRTAVPSGLIGFEAACELFNAPSCGGSSLGELAFPTGLGSTGGIFLSIGHDAPVPAAAQSALCSFIVVPPIGGGVYDAWLDELFFGAPGAIFADGFESGDTSAWSATVPLVAPLVSEPAASETAISDSIPNPSDS